jgi:hypothetical protein
VRRPRVRAKKRWRIRYARGYGRSSSRSLAPTLTPSSSTYSPRWRTRSGPSFRSAPRRASPRPSDEVRSSAAGQRDQSAAPRKPIACGRSWPSCRLVGAQGSSRAKPTQDSKRDRRQVVRGDGDQAARPAGSVRTGRTWSRRLWVAWQSLGQCQGRELHKDRASVRSRVTGRRAAVEHALESR